MNLFPIEDIMVADQDAKALVRFVVLGGTPGICHTKFMNMVITRLLMKSTNILPTIGTMI